MTKRRPDTTFPARPPGSPPAAGDKTAGQAAKESDRHGFFSSTASSWMKARRFLLYDGDGRNSP
jgi:hypothetical protein